MTIFKIKYFNFIIQLSTEIHFNFNDGILKILNAKCVKIEKIAFIFIFLLVKKKCLSTVTKYFVIIFDEIIIVYF